ncbi:SIS domain-containing protein [Jatrophihabitans telluris]|uniref:SIS domain-containing protein n=1 Tax=Jatrophihabitans telluris TaxID=2038343 RepID=A0ABY4QX46_9ACTN|nr:SIS domain-containing protein [Jatrophihabitans telluris]UQX88233.1 SIS domain-containing protein [Jatrophihabitans telluris]
MTESATYAENTLREIFSQPETWARALAQVAAGVPLPADGEKILFLGCGTSYYIGEAYARLRNALGKGQTRAFVPTELSYVEPDETVIVLSRSGTTSDVISLAKDLRSQGHRVVGIVGTPQTPMIDVCDDVIMMAYADEVSVVQTRFASTAFTLLRASLQRELGYLPEQAAQALTRDLPDTPEHVVFLGTGFSLGLAHEAALKCLESSGMWAEAYAVMEYQHGPISAAGPGTVVWPLVPVPDSVSDGVLATGARLVIPTLDPQAELVSIHRLAVAMAAAAGRNPDVPPYLSRSVQLD